MNISFVALAAALATLAPLGAALACTRILWNDNELGVFSSRSMDWPESTESVLAVLPRGMERDGGALAGEVIVAENPARWTSKYGSLVSMAYGAAPVDGLNEKGLAMHALYLRATNFGERDPALPGVNVGLWGQYVLDNAATVAEAVELLDRIQPVMTSLNGKAGTVHLALEDASGDSAVIEYVDGQKHVHHGRDYRIVTNDPTYDEQLALLAKMDFSEPSSDTPIPGNVSATDRFQRAAYFSALLPEPESEQEALAGVMAIARNVSVPFGAPYRDFGTYNTEFRTAMNLDNGRYLFELTTSPNVIWMELDDFDLSEGAPARTFTPTDDIAISGNVSGRFEPARLPF